MTDIIASILIGVSFVALWAAVTGITNWAYGKWESYRYAKWHDKDLSFITHVLRRKKR